MAISLTPEVEALIEQKVQSGRYASASEVVRRALRVLDEHERLRAEKLAALQRELQIGLDQLDRGEVVELDIERIKAEGRRLLAERNRGQR